MKGAPDTHGCRLACRQVQQMQGAPGTHGRGLACRPNTRAAADVGRAFRRRERERAVRVAVGLRHLAEAEAVLPQRVVLRRQRGGDAAVVELCLERALGKEAAVESVDRRRRRDDRCEAHRREVAQDDDALHLTVQAALEPHLQPCRWAADGVQAGCRACRACR